ncbi:DUF4136 domain-containing protein [Polymorphobacter sp.]|uniref:DUF4136 domain-containing protein n=1 Tax=Polymorphobacter sp. TaxID=1909290 RepID=UPI003F70AA0A
MRLLPALLAPALLIVAGCATTPTADVTRFHLGQPIPFDTISLVSPGAGPTLEEQQRQNAVSAELARLGFRPVPNDGKSAYVATLRAEQSSHEGAPQGSRFSIGLGGGTFGRNVGVGGGVNIPVGGERAGPRVFGNLVMLEIKRRSDNSIVWEGRAMQEVSEKAGGASLNAAVPQLVRALFDGFPGPSGQMVKVPMK